jgi:hypothetical protein
VTKDVLEDFALVTAKIVFAGTNGPIDGVVNIAVAEASTLALNLLDDGTFALSGRPDLYFPKLSTQSYQLHLQINATSGQFRSGSAQESLVANIPAGTVFPPPIDAGVVTFPADPISVLGQVTKAKDPVAPISGATVQVTDAGPVHPPVTSDAQGNYRIDNLKIVAPAQIQCSAGGFTTQTRMFLPDFHLPVNEEYFRLAP